MKNEGTETNVDLEDTERGPNDGGSLVERLLHAAGPGPEIPEDGAARVKDLIRPVWRDEVTARSRQRSRVWIGGIAAAAALIIAMVSLQSLRPDTPALTPQTIVVALIDGTLEVTPPGSNVEFFTADNTNREIPRGSLMRTGSGSRAALWLTDQMSLRLDSNTELRLDSEASLSLESGAVYLDSRDDAGSGIEVRTAFGTATDIGTQFEVRLEDGTLDLRVREGLVSLTRDDEDFQITQGIRFSVGADGSVSTSAITPYDPAWSWTQEIAPVFDIEGETVLAFLDWVSSETGLSIGFADTEVEQLAATTILHGSIEGLTPAQAPAVILPSARLTVSEEPGAMMVGIFHADAEGLE
jgi:ferric-dicitrate binding protein FerR (iron transport regulator)